MRLLDRYILRHFLQAYFYCIAAFISIWFIFDISDNISTFLEHRVSRALIAKYYLTQVPQILVILLPVALLLALLFSLGRMSRSNEIVSMLTAGVSLPRVLAPLLLVGVAHHRGEHGPQLLARAPCGVRAQEHFWKIRNLAANRDCSARFFGIARITAPGLSSSSRPDENEFRTVHVVQQDANDNIVTNYIATSAVYHPETRAWELKAGEGGSLRRNRKHHGDPTSLSRSPSPTGAKRPSASAAPICGPSI